jgi:hypothetical protein
MPKHRSSPSSARGKSRTPLPRAETPGRVLRHPSTESRAPMPKHRAALRGARQASDHQARCRNTEPPRPPPAPTPHAGPDAETPDPSSGATGPEHQVASAETSVTHCPVAPPVPPPKRRSRARASHPATPVPKHRGPVEPPTPKRRKPAETLTPKHQEPAEPSTPKRRESAEPATPKCRDFTGLVTPRCHDFAEPAPPKRRAPVVRGPNSPGWTSPWKPPRLQGFAPRESPPLPAGCLGRRRRVALLGFPPSRVLPLTTMARLSPRLPSWALSHLTRTLDEPTLQGFACREVGLSPRRLPTLLGFAAL